MESPLGTDIAAAWALNPAESVRDAVGDVRLSPKTITAVYIAVGGGALYLSDFVLPSLLDQPGLARIQALKGGIEILLTGSIIFVLSRRFRRQVERTNERLKRRGAELNVLHRVLRHNLRNDMNVIEGNASLVETKTDDGSVVSHCETIRDTVTETLRYTEQANRIRRVNEADPAEVNLTTWIPDIFESHPLVDESTRVEMELQDGLTASVNSLFDEAIGELVTNSIQHNESETPTIRVRAYVDPEDPEWVVIEAADNGPGISEQTWQIVQAGEESQLKHLEGLGLWFVYWTVQQSGGEIQRATGEMGGTELRIRLPRA